MKYYVFIFCFFILSITIFLRSEKLHEFQEPFKYISFAIDENKIYIADKRNCIIDIYSRKDFAHIVQFGRWGQGPTDFEFIGFLRIFPDYLFINAGRKLSYFSKSGDFIRTISPPFPTTGGYIPLGSNFVGKNYLPDNPEEKQYKIMVELFDSKFKKKKDLYLAELNKLESYNFKTGKRDILAVQDCFKLDVYNDTLYIGNTDIGFFFLAFDTGGKKLYEINLPYKKRRITSKDKEKIMDVFREAMGGEQEFNRRKMGFNDIFPKYYPAYLDFTVADGKLYVFLYPIPSNPIEVMILDLRGNLIRKTTIPKVQHIEVFQQYYYVYKGMFYYIHYNDETYKWELHVAKLD
jgi:hypothetical protein